MSRIRYQKLSDGTETWRLNDKLHRGDGPALIRPDGYEAWYQYGQFHREGDRPAMTLPNGEKRWYYDGELHRKSGPAVVKPDGEEVYYVNGVPQSVTINSEIDILSAIYA